jgi:uncharacterized membrane protein YedE/YeeE
MSNQQPTRASIKVLFIAMLMGSVLFALIAAFVPPYVGLDDQTALIMRIVICAAAVLNVIQAFWLRAKLTRQLPPEERSAGPRKATGTVQRQ